MIEKIIGVAAYILLAPLIGGLLDGLDRKISARMQGRVGPPVLQPFYDVRKLFAKQIVGVINSSQAAMLYSYLLLMVFSGCIFFAGNDILMSVFVLSTASLFLYFTAVITGSPYNAIAASRELIQIMTYEPAVILACVGFYMASGTFNVSGIIHSDIVMITRLPGFFVAFVFILTIKMRKSPFDVSTSHHAHQELVKGVTTEMGARNLAIYTVAEWYEVVYLLGFVALFVINRQWWSFVLAVVVILAVYFLEILIDNSSARVKYGAMLKWTWAMTLLAAGVNLLILMLIR